MKVLIPSPLYSYTSGKREVEASGATVGEVLLDLDRLFPGLRFRVVDEQDRVRPHIKVFIDGELANDLAAPLAGASELALVQSFSGG